MNFLKTNRSILQKAGRCIVLLLAAGFIGYGCYRGEMQVVFQKAITICLQCIGLG